MGSDRRTATSSTPRPSWRDRHLSQLTDEQLAEVKQHRGNEIPAAEFATVESAVTTKVETRAHPKDKKESKDPHSQAGLAPAHRQQDHQQPGKSEAGKRQGHGLRDVHDRQTDNRGQREYQPEERHYAQHAPSYESRSTRERNDRDQQPIDDGMQRSQTAQRPGRDHVEQWFREPVRRESMQRYDSRDDHKSDSRSPVDSHSAESTRASSNDKKGLVARILDYKPPALIKYGLMAFAVVVMVAVSVAKPIDHSSQSQLDSAFTRAMIGFGLARALNGVISVAQGTEFAVQPAGVGVNFSPGEILDPINDLVERFSWVMLLSTSAIGIQKILLDISSWTGISVLLAGAGLFFLLTRLRNSAITRMADIAGKLLLAMLLVRFLVPVGALANDWVYKQFLQPQYEQSTAELEVASERIREISSRQTQQQQEEGGSLTDRARRLYGSMTSKFDFDGMLEDYKQSAETVSENAVNLIVVFVLQTIIFPLLFMYLIYRLFRSVVFSSRPG